MEMIRSLFKRRFRLSHIKLPVTAYQLLEKFDVFYVCFDEPNRQANWQEIKTLLPKARKVEGVVGFDQALKTCAQQSTTDYFFLIDGDNRIMPERLELPLPVEVLEDPWVLSWSSLNRMNGLSYGNGGLKLWPREVALAINSHESAQDGDDQTDYCFIADYYLVDDHVSETVVNTTYQQAFRAGFREGVKMSLAWGQQVALNKENFDQELGKQNRERLKVWCEVGDDALNGCWGILGARHGLIKNVIETFDYRVINSYQWIDEYLHSHVLPKLKTNPEDINSLRWNRSGLRHHLEELGDRINEQLPLNLRTLSPVESLEFKRNFENPRRAGLLGRNPRL